jgi:UDP-N-acetylmuramoyl-L-alanyl-D-glutamate--2,6-diaminopimelate ligase
LKLKDLVAGLPVIDSLGDLDVNVTGVQQDSREVVPGEAFVALRGEKFDGRDFIGRAAQQGARAVLVEDEVQKADLPVVRIKGFREHLPEIARRVYGDPSRALRVIGVTGTNGKTTTTFLIESIMNQKHRCGLIGTLEVHIGQQVLTAERTTPQPDALLRHMRRMVDSGLDYVTMEVSSQGLSLGRMATCEVDAAVFTNLSQDHLDYHRTMQAYMEAKGSLFSGLLKNAVKGNKHAAVNLDDNAAPYFISVSSAPVVTFAMQNGAADVHAENVRYTSKGTDFMLVTPWGREEVHIQTPGKFSVYNALAASAITLAEGVSLDEVAGGLRSMHGVPGRFEPISAGQPFALIVDYAHTPGSIENILKTARESTEGRVIVVFGAGGDRDRTKRPLMANAASRLADYTVITSDNPRSEDPAAIAAEVEAGIEPGAAYEVVVDRRSAVRRAVSMAAPGDMVIIAGKGHEPYQIFRDRTIHFDDREEARRAVEELGF